MSYGGFPHKLLSEKVFLKFAENVELQKTLRLSFMFRMLKTLMLELFIFLAKEETPHLSRLRDFTHDNNASKENDISKEINDLKSVVSDLNRGLSDFKGKRHTSHNEDIPPLFSVCF